MIIARGPSGAKARWGRQNDVSLSTASDEEPEVDVSDDEFHQFDTSSVPDIITLTKVGRHYIVDATTVHRGGESQMRCTVSVSVNRNGQICARANQEGWTPSVIFDVISVGRHASQQFIALVDSA